MEVEKQYKGDKYIYLLMAYRLANLNGGTAIIGDDNGYISGQLFYRVFSVRDNGLILKETKTKADSSDWSKYYRVFNGDSIKPIIQELIDEDGNQSKDWIH